MEISQRTMKLKRIAKKPEKRVLTFKQFFYDYLVAIGTLTIKSLTQNKSF